MAQDVTMHDIEANGTNYILEWIHSEDGKGYVTITEACDEPTGDDDMDGDDIHMHEAYDFEEVQ